MAYANYETQGFSDDGSNPAEWSLSTGTDYSALISDGDSPNDSTYVYTSTNTDEFWVETNTAVSQTRDFYGYEPIRVTIRARRVGGTAAYLRFESPARAETPEFTTSWANYTICTTRFREVNSTNIGLAISSLDWKIRAYLTGGAQVQVSNIHIQTYPTADHGYLVPNGDGATIEWTPSTGTTNSALVDNFTGLTASDWSNANSSTTDYNRSSAAGDIDIYDIGTPTYTGLGTGDPVAIIIWGKTSGTTSEMTGLIDLIESGTSIVDKTQYGTYPRFTTTAAFGCHWLVLNTTPTNWANVQVKVTSASNTSGSNTLDFYGIGVVAGFDYVVATNYDVSITEAITVGDTQAALAAVLGSFAESITVGDAQSGLAGSFGTFAEGITVGDAQSALAAALGSVSEAVLLTDLFAGVQTFLVSISEGISVGDTQSAVASALAALSESITVGDTQTALAGALAALTEGVVTGDTQSGLATALAILAAENVNVNDVFAGLQLFLAAITEGITVGDSVSAQAAVLAAFTESLAAGDAPSATATALAALSEGITNAEVFAAVAAAYASVNEGILVGETWSYPLIGAHLVGTFSIEPLLAASPSNQALLAATVTTEGLEGTTITINR